MAGFTRRFQAAESMVRAKYLAMPRISSFLGIVITMYFDDHAPAHFHARYGGQDAEIGISPLTLLAGTLPPRVVGQVFEWAQTHQAELLDDWALVEAHQSPLPIAPLT
jgi:hypothetical protein